jgi:hypothetical protein
MDEIENITDQISGFSEEVGTAIQEIQKKIQMF